MAAAHGRATARTRYSFAPQYLRASFIFARRARKLEVDNQTGIADIDAVEHRELVTSTIMQCAAAMEAQASEIVMYGPANHLGRPEVIPALQAKKDKQEKRGVPRKYNLILKLIGKKVLPTDGKTWTSMKTLVELRNELVHYKSKWGGRPTKREELLEELQGLGLSRPPFISGHANFFPEHVLGADCADWAVVATSEFINGVYERLEIDSPLKACSAEFDDFRRSLPPRTAELRP